MIKRMDLRAYRWATIELSTLSQMRELMDKKGWIEHNYTRTIQTLELLFFTGRNRTWIYPQNDTVITIDGENVVCHNYNSADLAYKYYLTNGNGIGWCSDWMGLLSALCKSWGVATTSLWGDKIVNEQKVSGHTHILYFNPADQKWKAEGTQLEIDVNNRFNHFFIFQPKIVLGGLAESNVGLGRRYVFSKFIMTQSDPLEIRTMFLYGIATTQMKQWLLYS